MSHEATAGGIRRDLERYWDRIGPNLPRYLTDGQKECLRMYVKARVLNRTGNFNRARRILGGLKRNRVCISLTRSHEEYFAAIDIFFTGKTDRQNASPVLVERISSRLGSSSELDFDSGE